MKDIVAEQPPAIVGSSALKVYEQFCALAFSERDQHYHTWTTSDKIRTFLTRALAYNDNHEFAHSSCTNYAYDHIEGIKDALKLFLSRTVTKTKKSDGSVKKSTTEFQLDKPVICVSNVITVLSADNNPHAIGGEHWVSWVLLPKQYTAMNGQQVSHDKFRLFFFDGLNNYSIPQLLLKSLSKGIIFEEVADKGHADEQLNHEKIEALCPMEELEVYDCSKGYALGNQANLSDCGWWAVYYPLMTAYTGGIEFLEPHQGKRYSAKPLRELMPMEEEFVIPIISNSATTNPASLFHNRTRYENLHGQHSNSANNQNVGAAIAATTKKPPSYAMSSADIKARLMTQPKQNILPKAGLQKVDLNEIHEAAKAVYDGEIKQTENKIAAITQAQKVDAERFAMAKSKVTNKTKLHIDNLVRQKELVSAQRVLLHDIESLETLRHSMEISASGISTNQSSLSDEQLASTNVKDNNDLFNGEFFDSLMKEVANEDQQADLDGGVDKIMANINLLSQAKKPAEGSVKQYASRITELDKEIGSYNKEIEANNKKITAAKKELDKLTKQKDADMKKRDTYKKQLADAQKALLSHNADLDSSLHKVTTAFNDDLAKKITAIDNTLSAAENHFNTKKAGSEADRGGKIAVSNVTLQVAITMARTTSYKQVSRRVRNGNTGFPKWATRWKTVYDRVFDQEAFDSKKANLEGEHNALVQHTNAHFNNVMSGHTQTLHAARTKAHSEKTKLNNNKAKDLQAKLDKKKADHKKKSDELTKEVDRLKPLLDTANAEVMKKQNLIKSKNGEIKRYEQTLAKNTKNKKDAESRKAKCVKEQQSVQKGLEKLESQIKKLQQELTKKKSDQQVVANSGSGVEVEIFDAEEYQETVAELQSKRVELLEINAQLHLVNIEIQRLVPQTDRSVVPLVNCVLNERFDELSLLLEATESLQKFEMIDQKDEYGWTALQCAVARCVGESGNIMQKIIRRLIETNANLFATNPEGKMAFQVGLTPEVNQFVLNQALFLYCRQLGILESLPEDEFKDKRAAITNQITQLLDFAPDIDFVDGVVNASTRSLIDNLPTIKKLITEISVYSQSGQHQTEEDSAGVHLGQPSL